MCNNRKSLSTICKSSDMTPDWNGVVLVVDPTNSEISKTLGITKKGKYAIKVV